MKKDEEPSQGYPLWLICTGLTVSVILVLSALLT